MVVGLSRDRYHRYAWNDGPRYPGVTSIIGTLDKPGLKHWAARVTAEAAVKSLSMLTEMVKHGGADAASSFVKTIPDFQRDSSASLGTRVHALAEAMARGHDVTIADDEAPFIESYMRWMDANKPRIVTVEFMVYSERHRYGGTGDVAWWQDGELWMVDYKTGKAAHGSTALQLSGLSRADWAGFPGDPVKYLVPPATRFGVLHIRPDETELIPYDVTNDEWETFVALRRAHRWVAEREPVVKGQPIPSGRSVVLTDRSAAA